MSPGAFDYNAWLLQRGIVATGYVYDKGENHLINHSPWRYPIQSIRYHLQKYLHAVLGAAPAGGIITALIIGDRSGIDKADWSILQRTGTVLEQIPVGQVMSSVPRILRDQRDSICIAGQQWHWDGVSFHVLQPAPFEYEQQLRDNNRSCVLQITTPTQQVLLTGDIEAPAEHRLLARYGEKLRSSVLVIPHHGSRTSSTSEFLQTVNPKLALIPAGWHNRFHFPTNSVMARLQAQHIRIQNTASSGTIQIDAGETLRIHTYRARHRRYWQVW